MFFVFFKTNDVFEAEERLIQQNICCEIVPTPVTDRAYCGVCISIQEADNDVGKKALNGLAYVEIHA